MSDVNGRQHRMAEMSDTTEEKHLLSYTFLHISLIKVPYKTPCRHSAHMRLQVITLVFCRHQLIVAINLPTAVSVSGNLAHHIGIMRTSPCFYFYAYLMLYVLYSPRVMHTHLGLN
ncbi:hypothetical protein CEXT_520271 [Caerostris extrusa]|uniref:Uncharacterized protein n=1 Tax=Caerostris extrusa TaxID=172846 RepID=A0AAV4QY59_CAEEX|nr:hypothetical protein CEXT_520271 [Caerostris extrusa]